MRLALIGSGGSIVSRIRACPCFLIDDDTLIDCGAGALKNLLTYRADPRKIMRLLVSHCHADHITDIVPLLWWWQIQGREDPVEIVGPQGTQESLSAFLKLTRTPSDFIKFKIRNKEMQQPQSFEDVRACLTTHKERNFAYRIERGGRSVCYSADTAYSKEVVQLAARCDVLIHEATFLQDQAQIAEITSHSTARIAGRVAYEAQAKRLVIFHIPPPNEHREEEYIAEVSSVYGGEIIIGRDLLTLKV